MPSDAGEKQDLGTVQKFAEGTLSLDEALQKFDDAKKYVDTGFRVNWDNYFKVYKGHRVMRNYDGISDVVIREAHTIIETLVANIAGGNPTFHFVAINEEQNADTSVLNGMLDYYMVCNAMELKNQEWVREMLLYGTAVLYVSWQEGQIRIDNIPLRDFFVDPLSTGLVKTTNPALYAGYQYLVDKEVLRTTQVYDADQKAYVAKYAHLSDDELGQDTTEGGSANDGHAMDKKFKDLFNGSTIIEKAWQRQVHVILLHDLTTGHVMEIANRKQIIYDKPTWCQRDEDTRPGQTVTSPNGEEYKTQQKLDEIKPFLPFAILRDYVDTSLFYGEGEMSIIMGDAELLNDLECMDIDNNAYQNMPMYQIDPQFADLAPELETISGAVYPIPKGALTPIERPQLGPDLDNKKDRVVARMRRDTAADEAVQGANLQGSRITATEVSTQIAQAQNRFSTKISNMQSEGYAQLGEVIFKIVQIFVSRTTAVRIVGKRGLIFKDYDPWEYNGQYECHVELDSTIKQKQLEVGQKNAQLYQAMLNDPEHVFDPIEVRRWIFQQIDPDMTDDNFNALLSKPLPPPPPKDPFESIQFAYKDAPPMIQSQIEQKFGFTPDPAHLGDAHNTMMEQAVHGADLADPATTAEGNVVPGLHSLTQPPQPMPAAAPAAMGA